MSLPTPLHLTVSPAARRRPNASAAASLLSSPTAVVASLSHRSSASLLTYLFSPKALAVSAAYGILLNLALPPFGNTFFNYGGGGNAGGGGGGGGEPIGGGDFWARPFSPAAVAKDDDPQQEWDPHGLPANIVVQLNKLSGFKKYKVSEILFFDRRRGSTVGTEDSFFEMVSLRPGGIYTKAQLQKELETLATCGMFEKVDLETKTNPDGTINITIPFLESTWQSADRFRCINVGLMQQSKPIEMDPDMTDKERLEYYKSQEQDYKRRIEKARPCLLPMPVQREILQMLREQGKVSARLLQRIRDRVQQWYHENGYACAQVVNFGNLNTKEVVCEVVEGDITQLVIQFQDKLGTVCEWNTQFPVIRRELPKQLFSPTSR